MSESSEPLAPDTAALGDEPRAVGALLIATALLRIGAFGATGAVGFDLTDLAHGHPRAVVVGAVGAAGALSEMLLSPLMARYADRFGRRRFLVFGPLLGALGLVLVAIVSQPDRIFGARVLEGCAAAAFVPAALATIAAATSQQQRLRARASASFEIANLAGYGLGGLASGFTYYYLHRGAFVVFACFYVAAAVIASLYVPHMPSRSTTPVGTVLRMVLGAGPIRRFIPAWMTAFAVLGAFIYTLPALMDRPTRGRNTARVVGQSLVHSLDPRFVAVVVGAGVLLLIIGIAVWTSWIPRLGPAAVMRRSIPGALLIVAAMAAINALPLGFSVALIPLGAVGIMVLSGFGPAAVVHLAACSETLSRDRSSLMAFYTIALAAGGLIGALLGGLAADVWKVNGLLILVAALALIGMGFTRGVHDLPGERLTET